MLQVLCLFVLHFMLDFFSLQFIHTETVKVTSKQVEFIFISEIYQAKMTRGNQRDLAREKAAKKAGKGKSANDTAANAGN